MDVPENLRHLVDELGEALVRALLENEHCRQLALAIQAEGYDMSLSLEATVLSASHPPGTEELHPTGWSQEDEALLRKFRISVD